MKSLNIAFGKLGKSMLFKQKNWGMIGGDSEAPALLAMLAQMNPNINFYILGRSDWKRLEKEIKDKINVNGNIIDVWESYDSKKVEETKWPTTFFDRFNISIDFSIIMSGPCGASSIVEAMYTIDETRVAKPSEMFRRYVGPITRFLNDSKVKYIELGEDPRYIPCAARDLFNRPSEIMSTRDNITFPIKHIKEYMSKDIINTEIKSKNFHVDKLFMMSEPQDKLLKSPGIRNNLISVYSNGLIDTGGMKKYPHIKEYILDNFYNEGAKIYGKWPEDQLVDENYRDAFDPVPMSELTNQMYNTKYSLMVPIKEGWPSSKFWKHLMFGIIPFWHPLADQDNASNSPEFLRLSSAEEFKSKIQFLENNPLEYEKLWNECQSMLVPGYFSGEFYNDLILNEISEKLNIDVTEFIANRKEINYKMSCLFQDKNEKITKQLF